MENQTIGTRYAKKSKLLAKLKQLFPKGDYTVEVRCTTMDARNNIDDHGSRRKDFILR